MEFTPNSPLLFVMLLLNLAVLRPTLCVQSASKIAESSKTVGGGAEQKQEKEDGVTDGGHHIVANPVCRLPKDRGEHCNDDDQHPKNVSSDGVKVRKKTKRKSGKLMFICYCL